MKQTSLLVPSIFILAVSFILMNGCNVDNNNNDYLRKVLNNLDQIKSATYYETCESYAPGDTSPAFTFNRYYKEYSNPSDTSIGSSFVSLLQEDTTQLTFGYDGKMRAVVNEDEKTIVIDSFKVRPLPFRPLTPPFFNYTKSIIKYALETKDSISMDIKDLGDSVHFCLTIFEDKQVEFFGKPHYIDNPYTFGDNVSKYEIWINKSTDLPYRIRREMSHDISVAICRNVELNKIKLKDFKASDYFQPDFSITAYGMLSDTKENDLVGKVAPDWVLKDANNNTVALKNFNSKVVMIQFTSVSCGPCRASIPFLKQLTSEYKKEEFDFVAIECTNHNSMALNNYQKRNDFSYRFLNSTKEVTKSYSITSFPVFFILDKNRVIRKVITGYGQGTTDKEIRDAINQLGARG